MSRYCFLLFCLLLPGLPALATPSAAVCVVKHQQQLLLVQDRVSSRYSLTGGYIDAGETPQQAALRELYEETGLRGRVIAELGHGSAPCCSPARPWNPFAHRPVLALSLCCRPPIWAARSSMPG